MRKTLLTFAAATLLSGCASIQTGDKGVEQTLKSFQPVAGKTSLYVCREDAMLVAAGVKTTVLVDGRDIGTVKPNTFVHAVIEPGAHKVQMRNDGIAGVYNPAIDIETQAGALAYLWMGVNGGGFGTYTIDYFRSDAQAQACVKGATYVVPAAR
ncbi:DUF2846 domain-containing protein [Leptothrix discophora]|uniref:DUF2846 domain-containing protein n=1 Tax=Leptothrix discophora TaxID=89 RepID=A0ABT9G1D4_LEPDI|nr:DUF2846 domain-containing protein [Leptothrix discophora]MDP4300304.1 DUF2846 domain-containing protein [Leptothrix discophora]